ncbi:MAG: hypothetical protein ACERKV_12480 [Clostridiaceae bacterium]
MSENENLQGKIEEKQEVEKTEVEKTEVEKIEVEKVDDITEKKTKKKSNKAVRFILVLLIILLAMNSMILYKIYIRVNYTKWEYKSIIFQPSKENGKTGTQAGSSNSIEVSEQELNYLGSDGWEIVTSYLEMETAYPDLSSEKAGVSLMTNVRPQKLVIILKRKRRD